MKRRPIHLKTNATPFLTADRTVSDSGTFKPVSFWQETVSVTPGPALDRDVVCDVAIVGGGFTGLSVAYHLKRQAPDIEVVLIEREVVGHGASGRNGGFAMPLLGWDLLHTARKLGEESAGRAYRFMYAAVEHVKRTVAEHAIDCDLETTGYLLLNTCPARARRARREIALAHRLGFAHEWLEGAALGEYIRGRHFQSGVFDPKPCVLNPAKLARGMKDIVERLGVRVFEQTPLDVLRDGEPVELRTPGGRIRARHAVMAVNGYGASLGFLESRILPVHTYIVLTEPLTDEQLESVAWQAKRASLETARNFIHYFRLTADNRILFGGNDAQLYWRGRYYDHDSSLTEALKARFREYFPALRGVRFTHEWGGVLGVTLDMFPTFGIGGANRSVSFAAGYSGHGVALANYAGAVLAPAVLRALGVPETASAEFPFFWDRLPMPLPPDPALYLGMKAYRFALHAHDRLQRA